MQLSVRDVAKLLSVSEKTVYSWIRQGKLPASKVNDQYRLNRAELIQWATERRINVSTEVFAATDAAAASATIGLADALRAGGIHEHVSGADKEAVLEAMVQAMPLPEEVDRKFLLELLLARESLGSTGLGSGIAVPHVRNPIVMHIRQPLVSLCFLERAIDFAAVDGLPVHTLFAIVSPTIKAHLHLITRLAFALRQPDFSQAVSRRAGGEEILAAAAAVDARVPAARTGPAP